MCQDRVLPTLIVLHVYSFRASDPDNTASLPRDMNAESLLHSFDSLYALTAKKKPIVAFFSTIALTQFLMGMYMVRIAAGKPGARD